ncbi:MAG TPA: hypothetical protein VIJ25_10800 [Methylococcales bacterium]
MKPINGLLDLHRSRRKANNRSDPLEVIRVPHEDGLFLGSGDEVFFQGD